MYRWFVAFYFTTIFTNKPSSFMFMNFFDFLLLCLFFSVTVYTYVSTITLCFIFIQVYISNHWWFYVFFVHNHLFICKFWLQFLFWLCSIYFKSLMNLLFSRRAFPSWAPSFVSRLTQIYIDALCTYSILLFVGRSLVSSLSIRYSHKFILMHYVRSQYFSLLFGYPLKSFNVYWFRVKDKCNIRLLWTDIFELKSKTEHCFSSCIVYF